MDTKELPLAIIIAALIKDNKILLIKREKGDYIGLLGLPGGKIEKHEHLSDAARREILEESGIDSDFVSYIGFVSEHLIEAGNVLQHFLIHVCELNPKTADITCAKEGKLDWYDMGSINDVKDKIIPSDFLMLEKMIKNKEKNYYNCVLEKKGGNYELLKFE